MQHEPPVGGVNVLIAFRERAELVYLAGQCVKIQVGYHLGILENERQLPALGGGQRDVVGHILPSGTGGKHVVGRGEGVVAKGLEIGVAVVGVAVAGNVGAYNGHSLGQVDLEVAVARELDAFHAAAAAFCVAVAHRYLDAVGKSPVTVGRIGRYLVNLGHGSLAFLLDVAALLTAGILLLGDVGHQRVEIVLQIGVAVGSLLLAVAAVLGIQTVGGLPCVGHAVAVAVGRGCVAVQHRPGAPVVAGTLGLVVVLAVHNAFVVALAGGAGLTIAHIAHHLLVETVTGLAGTGIGEHALVGGLGCVGGGEHIVDGCVQTDGVFHGVIVQTVVVVGVDLVVHAVGPVVLGHIAVLRVHIAVYIVFAPDVQGGGVVGVALDVAVGADAHRGDAALLGAAYLGCAGTGLVVVVHNVHMHGLATVAAVAGIVVDHIVAHVHTLVELRGVARTQTGRAALVMGQQVVVEGGTAAAPVAAVAVGAFAVTGILQTLGHKAPLHRGVLVAVDGETLVDAPTHRTVVDDDVLLVETAETVPTVGSVLGHVVVA